MISQADVLETDWGITLLTSGDKLNSTGATYFNKAVPGLGSMVPGIFQTVTQMPTVAYTPLVRNYSEVLQSHEHAHNASVTQMNLTRATTGIGDYFGISEGWSGFWLMSVVYLVVVSPIFASTGNPGWAIIAGFPVMAGAAWLGIGTTMLTFVLVVVLIAAVVFGIYFILGRFA